MDDEQEDITSYLDDDENALREKAVEKLRRLDDGGVLLKLIHEQVADLDAVAQVKGACALVNELLPDGGNDAA